MHTPGMPSGHVPQLEPVGVVYRTRNRGGESNTVLVYASPYGFKVLEGRGVNVNDPLADVLDRPALKRIVDAAVEALS